MAARTLPWSALWPWRGDAVLRRTVPPSLPYLAVPSAAAGSDQDHPGAPARVPLPAPEHAARRGRPWTTRTHASISTAFPDTSTCSSAPRTAPTASYRALRPLPAPRPWCARARRFIARPSLATSTLHPSFPHSLHPLSYTARKPELQPRSCCCPWFFSALRRTEEGDEHGSAVMLPPSLLSGLPSYRP